MIVIFMQGPTQMHAQKRPRLHKVIASVLACTVLGGCVYAPPPPGYRYVQGYGYVAPVPVAPTVTGQGRVETGQPPAGQAEQQPQVEAYQPEYAPGYYAYDPGAPVYAGPGYVTAYPDYAGAAVTGLAFGALAGAAIGSGCCYGGYGRGWGGRGYGGGWRGGGHRR
jgi:hypothetical protein